MSRLRPKVVLWWGIGLVAGSLVFTYAVTEISAQVFGGAAGETATALDQTMLGILITIIEAVNRSAPFIGAALIGASVVMFYIAKNLMPPEVQPAAGEDAASGKRAASAD